VLYTEDERVKICDFGSSKFIPKGTKSTPYIVSRYYRSPELILGFNTYNEKIDIFATGCIMAELFTLNPLFPGKSEGLQLFEQMCVLGNPSQSYLNKYGLSNEFLKFFKDMEQVMPCDLKKQLNKGKIYQDKEVRLAEDLIFKLIDWDPAKRLSATAALEHDFFKN
jgi:serine/threonine protein kinase